MFFPFPFLKKKKTIEQSGPRRGRVPPCTTGDASPSSCTCPSPPLRDWCGTGARCRAPPAGLASPPLEDARSLRTLGPAGLSPALPSPPAGAGAGAGRGVGGELVRRARAGGVEWWLPGDGCRQPIGATHGNTGRRRRRRGWTIGQEKGEERGGRGGGDATPGWREKGGEGGAEGPEEKGSAEEGRMGEWGVR